MTARVTKRDRVLIKKTQKELGILIVLDIGDDADWLKAPNRNKEKQEPEEVGGAT